MNEGGGELRFGSDDEKRGLTSRWTFLAHGFRVFFLLGPAYAVLAMAFWFLWLAELAPMAQGAPALWHGHEMVFGYALAAMAGFLLTASPNWTGAKALSGTPLAMLALVWLAGRLAMWLSPWLPGLLVAALDLAFIPALLAALVGQWFGAKSKKHLVFVPILTLIWLGNLILHLDLVGIDGADASAGLRLSILVLVLTIVLIGGRVVPAFTRSALAGRDKAPPIPSRPHIDRAAIALTVVAIVIDALGPETPYAAAAFLAAAALNAIRFAAWCWWRTWHDPLLWILHAGYAWIVFGLALMGLAAAGLVEGGAALHSLTVGAVGTMTTAIMSRAILGHSGRPLRAAGPTVAAYLLILSAGLLRVLPELVWSPAPSSTLALAALAWVAGFAVFTAVHLPMLLRPRADGRAG
ncbi:MAG: NnrS family protein [Alphaproteobacteria bacterium]|jgi:uncharacterized protein involved in response to NO|nr:NnrS family protein [Alphaproteobacteria bacterium]